MKWKAEECKAGDIVRSKHGSVYHFGIYVSDEEVIQFGKSPLLRKPSQKDEDIEVVATDISEFSCGKTVERAVFGLFEKRFSPKKTISRARARMGERGYNFLHNNCEHFAYECATGKKYSSQEELLRKKWLGRQFTNVYLSEIPPNGETGEIYPPLRAKEIAGVKNEKVRTEKYWVWKLLLFAIEDATGKDKKSVEFNKTAFGKWQAKGFYFSLSHSSDKLAVAISSKPVGIDVEVKSEFYRKAPDEKAVEKLADKITANGEEKPKTKENLLVLWTKKESAYKAYGKGWFAPKKINTEKFSFKVTDGDGYVLTLCGNDADNARISEVKEL